MFSTNTNDHAPVFAQQVILIDTDVKFVWEALTTIDQWPRWQKHVSQATVHGAVQAGTAFTWKAGGLTFHSRIHTCEEHRFFGWTGKTIGASASHNWILTQVPEGTRVRVLESLDGLFPKLFRTRFTRDLEKGMLENLNELKIRALQLAN